MKRLLLCLAILSLLALPAMAQEVACVDGDGCPSPTNTVGIDVQGYVDGTASYQSGCVDQSSCEVGVKSVCDLSTAGQVTDFDCAAHVPGRACGVDVNQCSWDMSATKTETCSLFKEQVEGKFAVGSADMNSLGGVALCTSYVGALSAQASVYNAHEICNFAMTYGPGCFATAGYQGSQSLDLQADFNR